MELFIWLVVIFIIITTIINFFRNNNKSRKKTDKRRKKQRHLRENTARQSQQHEGQSFRTAKDEQEADFGETESSSSSTLKPKTTQPIIPRYHNQSADATADETAIYGSDAQIDLSAEATTQSDTQPYERKEATPYERDRYTVYETPYQQKTETPYAMNPHHLRLFANFDKKQWQQAMILAEILQSPRSKRPHQTARYRS